MGKTNTKISLAVSGLLLVAVYTSDARIIYVDGGASGANNGSSWTDAYNYLQDALLFATYGDEIRVAQGICKPDRGANQTPADRAATFQLLDGVTLKGGYAGLGQPDPDARDIALYVTILSGDLVGNDVDVDDLAALKDEPTRADNSYHVVTGSGTDETAVLDGFSIIAGNANTLDPWGGAGMCNVLCSPSVANCTFYANAAAGFGGGMFNLDSNPSLTNCDFVRNYGAGIYNLDSGLTLTNCRFENNAGGHESGGMSNWNSKATLTDCTFGGNRASWAGAISNIWQSELMLADCVFSGNQASLYGAIQNETGSTADLVNCTFIDNHAAWDAGAILNGGSGLTLTGCRFSGNSAGRTAGAVYSDWWATLKLTNCTLIENSADEQGGAVYNDGILTATDCTFARNYLTDPGYPPSNHGGGAVYNGNRAKASLAGCTFEANAAFKGGAVFNWWGSNVVFAECRFSRNTTGQPREHADWCAGGAIYNDASHLRLMDCWFTGNATTARGGAICNDASDLKLTNCLFAGNAAFEGGAIYDDGLIIPLANCTFAQNSAARGTALAYDLFSVRKTGEIANCILLDQPNQISINPDSVITITYSDVNGGYPGQGNIDADPCFVAAGYWADANDPSITVESDDPNAVWIDGDYHLMAQAGRWDPESQSWVKDDVTSPCVDAGDPMSPIGHEPFPNGGVINMGAYGGTAEASKSYFGEPICETIVAGDINGDCKVDFSDFQILCSHWLQRGTDFVNAPPTVVITAPTNGAVIGISDPNTPIIIRADASDPDGSVVNVQFVVKHASRHRMRRRARTDHDGTDGWQFEWFWWDKEHPYPEGDFTITATAMDDEGALTVSPEIVITVHGPD